MLDVLMQFIIEETYSVKAQNQRIGTSGKILGKELMNASTNLKIKL
jgi:hypothetical protein